jgi:hypothetical protein
LIIIQLNWQKGTVFFLFYSFWICILLSYSLLTLTNIYTSKHAACLFPICIIRLANSSNLLFTTRRCNFFFYICNSHLNGVSKYQIADKLHNAIGPLLWNFWYFHFSLQCCVICCSTLNFQLTCELQKFPQRNIFFNA